MAVPEVHSRELTSSSEFLILACDGIWEVLSDQEVWPYGRPMLGAAYVPHAAKLTHRLLGPGHRSLGISAAIRPHVSGLMLSARAA